MGTQWVASALWDPTHGPAHVSLGLGIEKGLIPWGQHSGTPGLACPVLGSQGFPPLPPHLSPPTLS